jgi:hypothetical protein
MYRSIINTLAFFTLLAVVFTFTSCKDDEPPAPNQLGFTETEVTTAESGDLTIEIALTRPASRDVTIEYDVTGTAVESGSSLGEAGDYEITSEHGEIVIPKGESTGEIEIAIISDEIFETDETIEIEIGDVSDESIIVTSDDEVEVTIENDDEASIASFTTAASSIIENGEAVEITVQLDKPAAQDLVIPYTLGGTSVDSLTAWNQGQVDGNVYSYDYYIDGVTGELQIPAGASSGVIILQPVSDLYLEDTGTIEITLTASDAVQVNSAAAVHTLDIHQEDGKVIWLTWDESYTTVDMDLFQWVKIDGEYLFMNASAAAGFEGTDGEYIFMPAVIDQGEFGASYNYYEGTEDPMNFTVKFINFTNEQLDIANAQTFTASYGLENINKWDDQVNGIEPPIAQTFTITNGVYAIDPIVVPSAGSRVSTRKINAESFQLERKPARFKLKFDGMKL